MKDRFAFESWSKTSSAWSCTGFYFRVWGYGLHISNMPKSEALFSERYGYRRVAYVFGWRIEVLKPRPSSLKTRSADTGQARVK